jgi:hypothetical protein
MTYMFKIHFNPINPRANYSQSNKTKIRSIDSNPFYQRTNLSQRNHKLSAPLICFILSEASLKLFKTMWLKLIRLICLKSISII